MRSTLTTTLISTHTDTFTPIETLNETVLHSSKQNV